eukprot:XP_017947007.1 PREDICTED: uncharacterized protein LOC108645773 [Xenopus tropicalis]
MRQLSNVIHYKQLKTDPTIQLKNSINIMLNAAVMEGVISEELYKILYCKCPKVPYIYFLPKIHKSLVNPPGRPIVSNVGSALQPLAMYIDLFLQEVLPTLKPCLKDTTEFLNRLSEIVPPSGEFLLCSLDVKDLYTSILHSEGINCTCMYLARTKLPNYQINFICSLLEFVLTNNYFSYGSEFYLQLQGCAMGANMAPAYANIYMDWFETTYIFSNNEYKHYIQSYMRYVDDTFFLWTGTTEQLQSFMEYLNDVHSTIKFTVEVHKTCLHFLDVDITYTESGFITSVYSKPTDRNNLLNATSLHPPGTFKGLPKSQFTRIRRITSNNDLYDLESSKMVKKFLEKGYKESELLRARDEVKLIPRESLLKKNSRTAEKGYRIPFVSTYDVNSGLVKRVMLKYWGILKSDLRYGKLFSKPPLFSYRKAKAIGDLIKSETKKTKSRREGRLKGTHPCLNCGHCNGIIPGDFVSHPLKGSKLPIRGYSTCNSSDVIYCIKCPCGLAYVGQTGRPIKTRLNEHKSTIRNYSPPKQEEITKNSSGADNTDQKNNKKRKETTLAKHFFDMGHRVSQVRWQILEKIEVNPGQDRKRVLLQRESYWIWALQTRVPRGLNEEFNLTCFL